MYIKWCLQVFIKAVSPSSIGSALCGTHPTSSYSKLGLLRQFLNVLHYSVMLCIHIVHYVAFFVRKSRGAEPPNRPHRALLYSPHLEIYSVFSRLPSGVESGRRLDMLMLSFITILSQHHWRTAKHLDIQEKSVQTPFKPDKFLTVSRCGFSTLLVSKSTNNTCSTCSKLSQEINNPSHDQINIL